MSNPDSIPVVLCGRSTAVGKPVSEALLPEIEVIHFIQTNEAAIAEIPQLLSGQDPNTQDNGVGTHNYTRPARAVIFGRGYDQSDIDAFRAACEGITKEPVAWIPPAPGAPPPGPGYSGVVANLVKEALLGWIAGGSVRDEVILY
ncbi:hypothetical protein N7493_005128 [Penicillium malachiteum]|uniref:Uncharacterized protein n=1 Tax=Penicillium malachiteum TaxID=1324776 RepID=A0AAD6HM35_9EURO|nr:hypothetical protein N7493_005128 [Penicillium malachiteum]